MSPKMKNDGYSPMKSSQAMSQVSQRCCWSEVGRSNIWEYMEGGFETVKWWDIPIASPIDNHYDSLLPFINSHFGKMKRRKMKYNRAGKSSRYRNKYSSFLPPEL